jgi:hypothetical protein
MRRGYALKARPSLLLLAALIPCGALAQTNAVAPASPQPELPPYMLRDPFWPPDWFPPGFGQLEGRENPDARWEEARKLIVVTGYGRNPQGGVVAIVKGGGVVREGDPVSVNMGSLTYKWRIRSISENGIVLEQVGVFPRK